LLEETLALRKAKLGPDHPDTLQSMHNLAIGLRDQGRYADAIELNEATLALRKARLGPDRPDTLWTMANLAVCYAMVGRYADALRLHEETLALRKTKLGLDHADTLASMRDVAASLVKLGRNAQALPLIEECLERAAGKVVEPRLIPEVLFLRLRHFEKVKDAAGCRATSAMWEQLKRTDAGSLYNAARMRAVTAAVLRAGGQSAATAKEADAEADRAMAWLTQAVAAGYQNSAHMRRNTDLDALRDREDFKKLLAGLEAGKN